MKSNLIIPVVLLCILLGGQNAISAGDKTDSLKTVLTSAKDTARLRILSQLFMEYRDVNPSLSEKYILEGLALAEKSGDEKWIANFRRNRGQYLHRYGKENEALTEYSFVLQYAIKSKDQEFEASVRVNIGALFFDNGIYDKAADQLVLAMRILDKFPVNSTNIKDKSACYTNLASVNMQTKRFDLARFYFSKSLILKKQMNDLKGMALIYNNMGVMCQGENHFIESLVYFKKAVFFYSKAGVLRGKSMALTNVGNVYQQKKALDSALFYFKKAYSIDSTLNSASDMTTSLLCLSSAYYEKKQYEKAKGLALKGLSYAKEVNSLEDQRTAYELLKEIYRYQKNYTKAFDCYDMLRTISDSIYNEKVVGQVSNLQIKYETEKKEQEIKLLQTQNKLKESNLQMQKFVIWSLGFVVFLIILLAYGFFNRMKLRNANKEAKIERDILDVENKLLRVQMNPHFIFNALNSIQSYITNHETNLAELYLAKFASLMRSILQNSTQNVVSLEEDLRTLQLYLELERLRFDQRFDFLIRVADDVDEEFTEIPPMLIQPFVENAIKHGIANKIDGQGIIQIIISTKQNILNCQIIDNGIGRGKSAELKQHTPGYKSMGMQLTGNRLKLLRQQSNIDIAIQYTDLKDEKGKAQGTQVDIAIPLSEIN
jgi:tetratricopeptide (TPR) repeat protein